MLPLYTNIDALIYARIPSAEVTEVIVKWDSLSVCLLSLLDRINTYEYKGKKKGFASRQLG